MPIALATNAMGTRFELVLDGGDPRRLRAAGEAALHEIEECHSRYNLFEAGSWLNTINRRAAHEAVPLDGLTYDLLRLCAEVHEASEGAFDVTVAPLMRAWGFRGGGTAGRDVIDAAKRQVGMRHVRLDDATKSVRYTGQGITLDLGGIAKGFAIDQAVEVLRESGGTCALLHGGTSTVAAVGAPPGRSGWRVSLKTGVDQGSGGSVPVVCLKDEALSISAPHGRTITTDTKTLGHVLDPRTGEPATCVAYAAVIGASACLTDAWATALLVLGEAPLDMPDSIRALLPDRTIPFDQHDSSRPPRLEARYA